jgi:hypothetical protein
MAFVSVPKDLSKIKNKALLNLTARQLICFSIAGAIGIPTYLLTRHAIGGTAATLLMIGLMLPMFFMAIFEKDGQPAEIVLRNYIRTKFFYPGKRPYKTECLYEILEKEGKILANQTKTTTETSTGKHKTIKSNTKRTKKI